MFFSLANPCVGSEKGVYNERVDLPTGYRESPKIVPQKDPARGVQRPARGTQRPASGTQRPARGTQRPANVLQRENNLFKWRDEQ